MCLFACLAESTEGERGACGAAVGRTRSGKIGVCTHGCSCRRGRSINQYVSICIAPNKQKSSEVLTAKEVSFELFCKCCAFIQPIILFIL